MPLQTISTNSVTWRWAGAGAIIGSEIGSIIPGPGTIIGGIVGGLIGGAAGIIVGSGMHD